VNHPRPWLKYVAADDLSHGDVDFDGLHVESPTGEKLGEVDGFVIDSDSARPYYVVVDAGGWFKSKHFLLPIGHARLSAAADRDALVADVTRDRVDRFPGFDKDEFDKLTPDSIKRLNDLTCAACSTMVVDYDVDEPFGAAWDRPDYRYPDWWQAEPTRPDRMGASAQKEMVDYPPESGTIDYPARERVVASERERRSGPTPDPSPHFDGRAQPGDVIGLETGGERTYVGDTAEDENKRREAAERAAKKQ
jgi:hypothetical protein